MVQINNLFQMNDWDVVCGWRTERKDPLPKKIFSKITNPIRRNITGNLYMILLRAEWQEELSD